MGNVRLYGATSGYTELAPPAVAPDGVLSLPSGTGTLLTAEGGKVLQIVRATNATLSSTTSTSFVDVTGMSVTITPTKATSTIIVQAYFSYSVVNTVTFNRLGYWQITNSSNVALSGAEGVSDVGLITGATYTVLNNMAISGFSSPATTSATTYKLRFSVNAAGVTANTINDRTTGQMYAYEVSA